LNERTDGYIFARQLKVHIEKVLNITISHKTISYYRLNILNLKFRRARMQPKIFSEEELDKRLTFAVNLKALITANDRNLNFLWSSDECSIKTGQHNFYHHRKPSSRPRCAKAQPRSCKTLHCWAAISIDGIMGPAVSFLRLLLFFTL